jgi:hypothetical protein
MLWLGLALLVLAVAIFLFGIPRGGATSFIGATETRASAFSVLFVAMLLIGGTLVVWSLG